LGALITCSAVRSVWNESHDELHLTASIGCCDNIAVGSDL
jgi:hypothetical protein